MPAKNDNAVPLKNPTAETAIYSFLPPYPLIVTKSVKGVYQNPTYMNAHPTPKIRLANKAT
ncbi:MULTISPECIES: hypothetical protein [Pseudomonas]|uniref:hypothetical protein n=1 Tax=Pseudomonas TaxID=286 RepID=UPI00114038A7|nr:MULTISPECIES: hypothetical protein [Pseudomonas]